MPIHAAIVMDAPSYLVLEILGAYPNAARQRDMNGSLPIHLAASRINSHADGERIMNHLMRAFPDSIGIEDAKGRTTIEIVKSHGRSIDTSESFSIEPEDDFMLGYNKSNESLQSSESATESEEPSVGAFSMVSGYTTFNSNEQSVPSSIEDDLEHFKSVISGSHSMKSLNNNTVGRLGGVDSIGPV